MEMLKAVLITFMVYLRCILNRGAIKKSMFKNKRWIWISLKKLRHEITHKGAYLK